MISTRADLAAVPARRSPRSGWPSARSGRRGAARSSPRDRRRYERLRARGGPGRLVELFVTARPRRARGMVDAAARQGRDAICGSAARSWRSSPRPSPLRAWWLSARSSTRRSRTSRPPPARLVAVLAHVRDPATRARCCAPPTPPVPTRWSSPASPSTPTTASACGPRPAACSICRSLSGCRSTRSSGPAGTRA